MGSPKDIVFIPEVAFEFRGGNGEQDARIIFYDMYWLIQFHLMYGVFEDPFRKQALFSENFVIYCGNLTDIWTLFRMEESFHPKHIGFGTFLVIQYRYACSRTEFCRTNQPLGFQKQISQQPLQRCKFSHLPTIIVSFSEYRIKVSKDGSILM